MSTRQSMVDAVLRALEPANVRARPMFGEYGIYCDDRLVGLVCDDIFYLKTSSVEDDRLSACERASPYPGAKDCYVIAINGDGSDVNDDSSGGDDWLVDVVQATAVALPPAKKRAPRPVPKG
jgi:hypothetical protein